MTPVTVVEGRSPVVMGFPHAGTFVPDDIRGDLNARGRQLSDTDWHIDRLYDGLLDQATTVSASFHRYVIDANRDPGGISLYPGQNTTDLIPLTDFDGTPIWNRPPAAEATSGRLERFHAPYHKALAEQLVRVKAIHGFAILYDCHSIRSRIPHLFDGVLPDFNIGTNDGASCARSLEFKVFDIARSAPGFSTVRNQRFKGGWTTRHYGDPARGIHAIQMELAQSTYLRDETSGWDYDEDKAARLRPVLDKILKSLAAAAPIPGGMT